MKRFNRIHIPHKVVSYVPSQTEKVEVEFEVKDGATEVRPAEEEYIFLEATETGTTETEEQAEEVLATPKPKRTRKKKTEETVENNEEKPEDNG